jgi:two-component system, LytTR family, response regulator
MSIRVLIVDDEPLGVKGVRSLLLDETDVEVVGECFDGKTAVQAIRDLHPDLVFLDVQMPGLDGFEVIEELAEPEIPLIIFVTAFDHYSLKAFAVHALDYLLKPLSRSRFQEALQRARGILGTRDQKDVNRRLLALLEEIERQRTSLDRFVVRTPDRILFLKSEEVEAIEATGNYMHLFRGRESFMIRETLAMLERRLDPNRFVRTHRSWIVNIDKIQEIHPCESGYIIHVQGGTKVPVSKGYREGIDTLMEDPLPRMGRLSE